MDLQELINKATRYYKTGNLSESLNYYNQAFEALVNEASDYSKGKPDTHKIVFTKKREKVYTVSPKYFEDTKKYLQKDEFAYMILKNLAVVYHETGDDDSAIKSLEQAIELAPVGYDNSDAILGLEKLKK